MVYIAKIAPEETLGDTQTLGVWVPSGIEQSSIRKADALDNQSVVLAMAHGISHEIRCGIFWQIAAVEENLAVRSGLH